MTDITQNARVQPPFTVFSQGFEAHKNRHCAWIVTLENYIHSRAFAEVAEALQGAFEDLGGSLPITTEFGRFEGRVPIIYGANLMPLEVIDQLPPDSIIMNLEQVSQESKWINSKYLTFLKHFPVLDYSPRNRQYLLQKGVPHAGLLEIGYHACLSRIKPAKTKDIDVLFYGHLNKRRGDILTGLQNAGLNVVHLVNVYGAERDAAIARSKIVLNTHYYSSNIFEIVRVSYLLANAICVVSEGHESDPEITEFRDALAFASYDALVERCVALIADDGAREAQAEAGLEFMQSRKQADMVMQAFSTPVS